MSYTDKFPAYPAGYEPLENDAFSCGTGEDLWVIQARSMADHSEGLLLCDSVSQPRGFFDAEEAATFFYYLLRAGGAFALRANQAIQVYRQNHPGEASHLRETSHFPFSESGGGLYEPTTSATFE